MALILLVDDDTDILVFARKILSSVGHDVVTAGSATEAIEQLGHHSFDLVISDANMPRHSGFDLLKVLRSDRRYSHLPVALLTARKDKKDIEHAIKLGVDDYIVKPIDPSLLVRKVDTLFHKKPAQERASVSLPEVDGSYKAQVIIQAEVLAVSEVGMVLTTPQILFEGQTIQLTTPLFEEIGIESPFLKVLSCESLKGLNRWRSRVIFVGADDQSLQKIRAWINSETIRQRAERAS